MQTHDTFKKRETPMKNLIEPSSESVAVLIRQRLDEPTTDDHTT